MPHIRPRRSQVIFPFSNRLRSRSAQNQSDASSSSRAAKRGLTNTTRSSKQGRINAMDNTDTSSSEIIMDDLSPLAGHPSVPSLFTEEPPLKDALVTKTSTAQEETAQTCVPLLAGAIPGRTEFDFTPTGVPRLERAQHVEFLRRNLQHAKYIPYDPARPWVIYWCLTALSLLGQDVGQYRDRVVETLSAAQNRGGGFGGGHGQFSHIAPSYAAICSLAIVGGKEAYELVDRRALWNWLGHLKQGDGGFQMCIGGEEDVRGAYCSLVIVSLLEIPLDLPRDAPARKAGLKTLVDGLPEYLSRCQTYEGGISGAPQTEAHGAYAYCALASLCILGPPEEMLQRYLDLPALIWWLSSRQYAPEGGFSGRTNKLVDGCYSHWVGGCWPLIDAAVESALPSQQNETFQLPPFFHREGLIRYILSCCQDEIGGLRDKPTAHADAYHSCYVLAGLSSMQYQNKFQPDSATRSNNGLTAAFQWCSLPRDNGTDPGAGRQLYDEDDTVVALHPIFVIPWKAVEETHAYFRSRTGFR